MIMDGRKEYTMPEKYSWIEFYTELADKLLPYKDRHDDLIKLVYELYNNTGFKMPTLESGGELVDIDPFSIYGLFNKGLSDSSRIKIISEIKRLFSIDAPVPNNFAGIPVLNNLNATFYLFKEERGKDDIDNLWDLFAIAINYADTATGANREAFINAFNAVKDLKGNRWKLTMALYWIRPYCYVNLDSRNRWFIEQPNKMPDDCVALTKGLSNIPDGELYLKICDTFVGELKRGTYSYKTLPELSAEAWVVSEEDNERERLMAQSSQRVETALGDSDVDEPHYWMYAAGNGSERWDDFYKQGIMAIRWGEIGDLKQYSSKEEMKRAMKETFNSTASFKNAGHATWQFANDMKPGDIIFVKRGYHEILGRGVVTSDYRYDPSVNDRFKNIRDVEWTHKGSWFIEDQIVQKTLTDVTQYTDYVGRLCALFEDEDEVSETASITYDLYSENDFLRDVFIDEDRYHKLVAVLKQKKNIILQGAPGVGKTYVAKRLAYSIMGVKDTSRVKMVQFHQSYSYEDFIMGYRPTETGFKLHTGAFYDFCKAAQDDIENDYFFIIDEINRGNISKIFGEMFMLIEGDKRGISLGLLYKNEQFCVPKNVYIIGMMNTADRSLAMLDYALRRRFAFFDFAPAFGTDSFEEYRLSKNNSKFDKLIHTVMNLNDTIENDESLGEGFRIGHSYFVTDETITDELLDSIVEYELIPLLKEYWFDEPSKVRDWSGSLRRAIK